MSPVSYLIGAREVGVARARERDRLRVAPRAGRGSMLIRSCQLGQSRFAIEKARGEPSVRP